jgi:TatD DNase family protein
LYSHVDDFDLILERAQRAGVEKMIITGTDLVESRKAAAMTDKKEHGKHS